MFKVFYIFVVIFACQWYVNGVVPMYPGWGCRPTYYNSTGTNSIFLGCVQYTDKILYSQNIAKSPKWFAAQQVTVTYPMPGYIRNETITGVWLFDFNRNGTGGYARILQGGVGMKTVTINISNAWFKGFNYLIQIYGR